MKILYLIMPLLILVASPSFAQNSISQSKNKFNICKEAQKNYPRRRKKHRGSGRRCLHIVINS